MQCYYYKNIKESKKLKTYVLESNRTHQRSQNINVIL